MTPIELVSRREALGLTQSGLSRVLAVSQVTVSRWESGTSRIPDGIDAELRYLEGTLEGLIDSAVETVEAVRASGEVPVLFVWPDDASFAGAHPEMDGLPAVLHRVAMARAAVECGGVELVARP